MANPPFQGRRNSAPARSASVAERATSPAYPARKRSLGNPFQRNQKSHPCPHGTGREVVMTNYAKLTIRLTAAWFIAVLAASGLHVFSTAPSRPPIPLGLAALLPIVVFWLWQASSEPFRRFTLAL